MESPNYNMYQNDTENIPERPDFLKILCIFSFVSCGLWILVCALGTVVLTFDSAMIEKVWAQAIEDHPELSKIEPVQFMHDFGMWCIYSVIANIFSLIGVVMMWRLEKIGFFVYTIAELSTAFFWLSTASGEEQSHSGTVFFIVIDLIFIGMYAANLKYMSRKNNNAYIQSGS